MLQQISHLATNGGEAWLLLAQTGTFEEGDKTGAQGIDVCDAQGGCGLLVCIMADTVATE